MRKLSCIIIALIFIVSQVFISCASRRSEPIKDKVFAPRSEKIIRGESYYMQYCQKCHPGGEAGLGPSINANPAPMFLKRFQVRHGLGVMPSFKKDEITKQQLDDMVAYMKSWKKY